MHNSNAAKGFSLIELSIVLVIIGLIVGGVLVGRDLIKAAELRSVVSDLTAFDAAIATFRGKFNCLPGDCTNATSFFGTDSLGCGNGGGSSGTCNGDGNAVIWWSSTNELYRAWQQLALAGLIAGKYTGISGPGGCGALCESNLGINVPISRYNNSAGYMIFWEGYDQTNDPNTYYNMQYGNDLFLGKAVSGWYTYAPIFTPKELSTIDSKMDDGTPIGGKVTTDKPGGAFSRTNCTTSASDTTGAYMMTTATPACMLIYRLKL